MTREEIMRDYEVRDGVICSPGKFEGEPLYAPAFWDAVLNGMAEELEGEGVLIARYFPSVDDRKEWPELGDAAVLYLYEDSQGFVHARTAGR